MKQTISKFNIVLRLVVIASLLLVFGMAGAQTSVDELKNDVSAKQEQLRQINDEILNLQREINRKQQEVASLKNEIALYDLQIQQTEKQIAAVELAIEQLNGEIIITENKIEEKQNEIAEQKDYLAETLRLLYEFDEYTPLEITLGNDNFSDFLDQIQYADNLQEQSQDVLAVLRQLNAELEAQKAELQKQLTEQQTQREKLTSTINSLNQQRNGKEALLTITRGKEAAYSDLLDQASVKQEEIAREILNLEVALRRQLGDPSLPPITGVFRWPASGILTQGYGNTGFTALGYSFHNGLDIAGPPGTNISASADGVVYAVGTGEAAYGNWVVIQHTIDQDGELRNIYSLYAHLQKFIVTPGQPVLSGDLIGFMGNTGNTTRLLYGPERGFHLHFAVFDEKGFQIKDGAYQDVYGPYQIPVGITYNPLDFLQ